MQFTDYREAKHEAEYVHGGGDGEYTTWVFMTPEHTFYVVPDARFHDTPGQDVSVARIRNYEWKEF